MFRSLAKTPLSKRTEHHRSIQKFQKPSTNPKSLFSLVLLHNSNKRDFFSPKSTQRPQEPSFFGFFQLVRFSTSTSKPMQASIEKKLTEKFNPVHLEVVNESYKHSVPKGSETHFKVVVVSDKFEGLSLVEQHRAVNSTLADELKNGVHALSIQSKTPAKWIATGGKVAETPNCLGGGKK
eukprot:TRINITY_DN3255_c0_g1_i1.p1 TRINITY_DN3255_c0_g1~~TRINITY_DN3255_c0_g1_i1.p1  ORF type:complete len:180 (+),score=28.14 TRINITY_DN3255_c0_g1_i1:48-587(+)